MKLQCSFRQPAVVMWILSQVLLVFVDMLYNCICTVNFILGQVILIDYIILEALFQSFVWPWLSLRQRKL